MQSLNQGYTSRSSTTKTNQRKDSMVHIIAMPKSVQSVSSCSPVRNARISELMAVSRTCPSNLGQIIGHRLATRVSLFSSR